MNAARTESSGQVSERSGCPHALPPLLQTVDVQAKFVNGKPDKIECKYVMRSSFEWDR